jgi:putative tryptophan/tyrosine transport system substrate-binding protein
MLDVRRRDFMTLLGGAAVAWPLAAQGQQGGYLRRVGVLTNLGESDPEAQSMVAALHQTLRQLGWVDGRNIRVEHRWAAGNPARIADLAKQLVALQPDVIVAHTSVPVIALRQETATIPIVFVQVADPIGSGFITNLAHPGGNITGFSSFEPSMGGKWAEMLKEIAPSTTKVAFLFNPKTAPYVSTGYYQRPFNAAAASLGIELAANPVDSPRGIESAVSALGRDRGGGLIVIPDSFNLVHREHTIMLAAHHRVPAIYPYAFAVREGGLISYGVDQVDLFRRAAVYVDRILKGEKPVGLPAQTPTKFESAISLKAAKALGLTVPDKLLALADEVIE